MKLSKIAMIFALALATLVRPTKVSASAILFEDNFNDGDFSDWTVVRNFQWNNPSQPCLNQGKPANWEILDGRLGITIDGPSCMTEIVPNNLDLSGQDFLYEFDWKFPESAMMDRVVIFIWKDKNNWYDFKILDDVVQIQKVVGGSVDHIDGEIGHYKFSANTSYHFKITVKERDTITLTIDDNEVIEVTDTLPFIDGFKTVGLQAGVGAISRSLSYFDNILVTSIAKETGTHLNVPLLKQSDPAWKNDVYDHATSWTQNPTLNRWGCALTSMAMIMQHYGLSVLPDGQLLNPSTLNQWLKTQADGYLGQGNLNWVAVTRLTRLINEKLGTPKLEYRRLNGSSLETAKAEIEASKPVILEIAGHFLVGDGVTSNGSDVEIKDPAYDFDRFSQHQATLLSTRTFQPSYTDLSYLVMAYQPGLNVSIMNGDNQPITSLETFTESLNDPTPGSTETSPTTALVNIAQPVEGTYKVVISQPNFGPFNFQLLTYDLAGNPTIHNQSGWVGPQVLTYVLNYSETNPSTLSQTNISFTSFRQDLMMMKQAKQFNQGFVFTILDALAQAGEKLPKQLSKHQVTAAKVIAAQIEVQTRFIQPAGKAYLQQQIQALITSLTNQR